MKHPIPKLLAALLTITMLTTLFPATNAATTDDLRHVVANQATTLANMEWKLGQRINSDSFSDAKKQRLYAASVLPTFYFESSRLETAYIGAIVSEYGASYEKIAAELTEDGSLSASAHFPGDTYGHYGMNPDAFLVDVVSRVSPTKITGVKQALTSGALSSYLSGVNVSAKNSQDAAKAVDTSTIDKLLQRWKTKLRTAYGKLQAGDLLIAWNDNSEQRSRHVLVVTHKDVNGSITVTYPDFNHPVHHYGCNSCPFTTEVANADVLTNGCVVSNNSRFGRFKTHKEVDSTTTCQGTLYSKGATTWRTATVSTDNLQSGLFTGVSTCYLPYTLSVYSNGAPAVKASMTPKTDLNNLTAGFSGTITSNYRITQVDAILSTPGADDQVFTHYPDYDAWTYEFEDEALNVALANGSAANCSLTVNVHSGPIADPATMADPVTEVLSVSSWLSDPSFELTSDVERVHQGQSVRVGIKSVEDGINAAQMDLSYDRNTYAFDLAKTRRANTGVTFSENADGSIHIVYSGSALTRNAILADLYFIPHRTGNMPIPAEQTGAFAARSVWKATANDTGLVPSRFGGDPLAFAIGYNLKVYNNYAGGKSLLLLGMEGTPAAAKYNGQTMIEVTPANYKLNGVSFTHTYAIVADSVDLDKVSATTITSTSDKILSGLLNYDCDVNRSGGVNIRDAQAAANIMAGNMPLDGNMEKWLIADVDASGKVDAADIVAILAAANQ